MWCSTCQQDVPCRGTPGQDDALRCSKCERVLADADLCRANSAKATAKPAAIAPGSTTVQSAASATIPGGSSQAAPLSRLSADADWELEAELRGVQRLVGTLKASSSPIGFSPDPIDLSDGGLSRSAFAAVPPTGDRPDPRPRSNSLAWTVLSLGLATFACGGVLLGWSFAGDRADLWPLGLPLALIGQAGLIIGLVLQLEGLWHTNRQTADSLTALDGELSRVRHATTLLTTTKNPSAQSFYAHLAEGASPQLLLADLKGQMDLLAQQLAARR